MKTIILTLLLMCCAYGQYDSEISSYTIYWHKIDAGQSPVLTDVFRADTVITFLWENGDGTEQPYISPYTSVLVNAMVIVNSPTIWTDNTAAVARDVILDSGIYETTITASDMAGNESLHSDPMFLRMAKNVARIQINLRIR